MNANEESLLWVEKYRPKTLKDCILPKSIKQTFEGYVKKGSFENLLLFGNAGIGKTTLAKALCNELGMEYILINTSNERGIDVLRQTISEFASSMSMFGSNEKNNLKCVILDEFDYSSQILQTAMRSFIEEMEKNCRFIFTCNYPNRIIQPIHSRCSVIGIGDNANERKDIENEYGLRLATILNKEGVAASIGGVKKLIDMHFPDFRRIINEAQRLSQLGGVSEEILNNSVERADIDKLMYFIDKVDFDGMRSWVAQNANKDFNLLYRDVYEYVCEKKKDKPSIVSNIILLTAKYQFQGVSTPDPEINFIAYCLEIMLSLNE